MEMLIAMREEARTIRTMSRQSLLRNNKLSEIIVLEDTQGITLEKLKFEQYQQIKAPCFGQPITAAGLFWRASNLIDLFGIYR